MTPKLEICAAHDNFVAATYTPDKSASITALGLSACDAVANLRVYLQPFGYELPNVEVYASGGAHAERHGCRRLQDATAFDEKASSSMRDGHTVGMQSGPLAPASPISECESAVDRVFKQHLSTGRN